jgi:hypothetical protein
MEMETNRLNNWWKVRPIGPALITAVAWVLILWFTVSFRPGTTFLGLTVAEGYLWGFQYLLGMGSTMALIYYGVAMPLVKPSAHKRFGKIVVLCSVISLVTNSFGGAIIGFALGTVGGILTIRWKTVEARSDSGSPL